jgi:hypothetical protein
MKYEWDENKRLENIRKHGIDFVGCEAVFDGYTRTNEAVRFPYSEHRFITLGLLEGRVVVVAHTEMEDVVRIISIRKAKRHEQEAYFQDSPLPEIPD